MVMKKASMQEEFEYGMTLTRLGELFGYDRKTVQKLLKECPYDGERNGVPYWHIANAASYLVTPLGNMEDYLRKLKPKDLPPSLQKDFWTALRIRSNYYKDRGDLWSTARVQEVMSDMLKVVRETSKLFVDSIESKTTVTTAQREAIQKEMDRMLAVMRAKLTDAFKDYDPSRDHVESLESDNVEQQIEHSGSDNRTADDDRDSFGLDEDEFGLDSL